MNEQQLKEAFMQYLQQKSGAQTEQEFEDYIQQLGEEGLQQEYAQFMQMMQQQQVSAKKFGGMLNYIGKLRGVCPEGYEMQFFKQGGQICKECVQKAKMEEGGKTHQNPVDAFKCGRKMKKKACGGNIKKEKGGGDLPTAEPTHKRYRGGNYVGPNQDSGNLILDTPKREFVTGPNKAFKSPALMMLEYDPIVGDSTITEIPAHYSTGRKQWWLPNPVKVKERIATNKGGNPKEWEIMKRRWEDAKGWSKVR